MKPFIANQHTYETVGNTSCEVTVGPSLTIPGMTISLDELLKRYVKGDPVRVFQPVYTDDPNIPDKLELMDEIERKEHAVQLKDAISTFQQKIKKPAYEAEQTPDPRPDPEASVM